MLVYVDGIILTGNNPTVIDKIIKSLSQTIKLFTRTHTRMLNLLLFLPTRMQNGLCCLYWFESFFLVSKETEGCLSVIHKGGYKALVDTVVEITWIEALLQELCVPMTTMSVLWCENLGANLFISQSCTLYAH